MEFRTLKADEIDVKVGNVTSNGYTLLLYKNARVDMAILDETAGTENWQRDHKEVKGNLYCGIGINFPDVHGDSWVWKWDCGVESQFGDKEKGEASDSFKRACVNWGIGRELYTAPKIYVDCETYSEDNGKHWKIKNFDDVKRSNSMRVKEIEYNDRREITKLVIVDNKGVQVYPKNNMYKQTEEKQATGGDYVFQSGKYKGQTIRDMEAIKSDYLDWLLDNSNSEIIKQNIIAFRKEISDKAKANMQEVNL